MMTTRLRRLAALWALSLSCACGGDLLLPTLQDFSPRSGTIGTRIVIQGIHFDRDGQGYPAASGSLPWQVYLLGADRRYLLEVEDVTDHSLVVVVPEGAATGNLALADATGTLTETEARFEVLAYPTLRVVNGAQYDVVDLRFNGTQMLHESRVLESGTSAMVDVAPDTYRIEYGLGTVGDVWVRGTLATAHVTAAGAEVVAQIPALSLLDVLTRDRTPTDWVATITGTNGRPTTIRLRFYGDGTWARFDAGVPSGEGTLQGDAIAPYASAANFRLFEGGPTARFSRPFKRFDVDLGISHWRLLSFEEE